MTLQTTFLQRTLGRNYKWWYLVKYNISSAGAGSFANFLSMFGAVITTVTTLYIWQQNSADLAIFTYLLLGRIYKSMGENYHFGTLSYDIISGKITNILILPQGVLKLYYFTMIGKRIFRNLLEVLGAVLATIICVSLFAKVQLDFNHLLVTFCFIPITFTINHFTGSIIGSLGFFIRDKRDFSGIDNFYVSLRQVLAGLLIPLNLLPYSFFFESLPWSFVLHHPMQIYLGKYNGNYPLAPLTGGMVNLEIPKILLVLVGGIIWCIVLYFLAKLVFKMGLKRNESVGL